MRRWLLVGIAVVGAAIAVAVAVESLWWWHTSPRQVPFPVGSVLQIVRAVGAAGGLVLWALGKRRLGGTVMMVGVVATFVDLYLQFR